MRTKVKFLINDIGTDIFAFFPDEVFDNKGNRACYSQIGQYSGCCDEYANESRLASKDEYKPLYDELVSIGYDLEIIKR